MKRPAAQVVHAEAPSAEYWPEAQLPQLATAVAPAVVEKVPAGQLAQAKVEAEMYVPDGQTEQVLLPAAE